jgi:hypothetical protein
LEKCAINEAELEYSSRRKSEVIQKFLKFQEKNLKKLIIKSDFDMPNDLKVLRLTHFEFYSSSRRIISLKQQIDLKFLRLQITQFSNEVLNRIFELTRLETQEILKRMLNLPNKTHDSIV